jgi:hypothetical protein
VDRDFGVVSGHDPALPDAAAKPAVHRRHGGKRLVVLVGMRKAVAIAVRTVSGRKRWSKLRDWLSTQRADLARSTFES